MSCGKDSNDGEFQTCCISGYSPYWGCKKTSGPTLFDTPQETTEHGTYYDYITYNNVKYYVPVTGTSIEIFGKTYWEQGAICTVFNCYIDKPGGNTVQSFICGNFKE